MSEKAPSAESSQRVEPQQQAGLRYVHITMEMEQGRLQRRTASTSAFFLLPPLRPGTPLPFTGPPALEQQLAQENAGQGKLLEQRRLDPKRPPSGPYRRVTHFRGQCESLVHASH